MNILVVAFVFELFLIQIQSDNIGYNELNLIEEGKPFRIKCIPASEVAVHFDLDQVKWFNVTAMSTDPYDHQKEHVLLDQKNDFVSIGANGELYSESARPEHNGYYSCRVHYSDRRNPSNKNDHILIDYRLHLIEVTKRPLFFKLEDFLVIEVFTDSDSVNNEMIGVLLKDVVLNKDFETNISFDGQQVLCEYNSDSNLMKCQLKIKSSSKTKCQQKECSSQQNIFEQKIVKDLQKIQNLLKTNDEVFKRKLKTQLIDFEVKRSEGDSGQGSKGCADGYYSYSYRCRPCPSGKNRTKGQSDCRDCPLNTFNPYFGQSSCIDCPPSSQTAEPGFEESGEGATDLHACKFIYGQGFYGAFKDLFYSIFV